MNDTFEVIQILQDGVMAVYNNLLRVYSELSDVIGNYTCVVENLVSEPDEQTLPIQGHSLNTVLYGIIIINLFFCAGLTFIGSTNVRVGQNATISCTSDLHVQSVSWMLNNNVVETSNSQQVDLIFGPVVDYLHNREYTCRAITSYGVLERTVTLTVESKFNQVLGFVGNVSFFFFFFIVPESAVSASISTVGNTVAGEMYEIVCEAVLEEGIQSTPVISWLGSDGERLTSGGGISVGPQIATSLSLEFSILRTSYSGQYTCQVTLYSLALRTPLSASASITLNVIGKFAVLDLLRRPTSLLSVFS